MSLLDDLVAYWKLDEASGNALDAHGSLTLTETGGTIDSVAGKVSNARDFEAGDTEWFEHAADALLNGGDFDYSFSIWINAESLVSFPIVFCKNAGASDNDYALYYDTSGNKLTWNVAESVGGVGLTVQWGSALSTSTWYHVVVWHDAANNLIGIAVNDGTPVTTALANGNAVRGGVFQVGASSNQGLYWDGLIDEFGLWARVLTSGERTSLYNSGNGLAYSSFAGGGGGSALLLRLLTEEAL